MDGIVGSVPHRADQNSIGFLSETEYPLHSLLPKCQNSAKFKALKLPPVGPEKTGGWRKPAARLSQALFDVA